MLYKNKNNNIQVTLHRKTTDKQAYLKTKSEQPKSLKSSIPKSQFLILKAISSAATGYDKNCAVIKQNFLYRQYKEEVLNEQIKKLNITERKRGICK